MRDYAKEFENRVAFIRDLLKSSGAKGVIYGNSGGKDSALVGILCKAACDNTVGIMMPCASKRNFGEDMTDGLAVAEQFNIETRTVDLTAEKELVMQTVSAVTTLNQMATSNIAPRLRMLTLYTIGAAEGRLVAGTGNRSEAYMGYFTKWGDGAYDFNPIADLTVTEIYESAREKIADCLVNGKRLVISGGNYRLCEGKTCGCGCGCADCRCSCCRTEK